MLFYIWTSCVSICGLSFHFTPFILCLYFSVRARAFADGQGRRQRAPARLRGHHETHCARVRRRGLLLLVGRRRSGELRGRRGRAAPNRRVGCATTITNHSNKFRVVAKNKSGFSYYFFRNCDQSVSHLSYFYAPNVYSCRLARKCETRGRLLVAAFRRVGRALAECDWLRARPRPVSGVCPCRGSNRPRV